MLISAIITEIVQETGGDTSDTDLAALILTCIKGALRRFPLFSRTRGIKTTSSISLTSGASSTSLPSGFINEEKVYWLENGARRNIEDHPNFSGIVNTQDTGVPAYYEIVGATIYFDRKADKDYTIYIEHFKEIDAVAAGDTWAFDSSTAEILKDGAKYTYYSDYTEDQNKGAEKLALFKAGLQELESKFMIKTCGTHISDD